ncbi:hypothetical protein ISCGN_030023 [Ixodes scapularis]
MLIMKILFLFALIKTTWGESFSEMCENVKLGALELEKENCMAPTYYKNRSEELYQRYSEQEPQVSFPFSYKMLIMKILFLFALIKTTWGESFSEMCENVKLGALELEKENCMAPTYYKNRRPPPQEFQTNTTSGEPEQEEAQRVCWAQDLFYKHTADCARGVLEGPAEAGVEAVKTFLATRAGIMSGPPLPPTVEPLAKPDGSGGRRDSHSTRLPVRTLSLPDCSGSTPDHLEGLTKSNLKLTTVKCLQGGLRCFWGHRRMTTDITAADEGRHPSRGLRSAAGIHLAESKESEWTEFCQPFWDYGACMPGETNRYNILPNDEPRGSTRQPVDL